MLGADFIYETQTNHLSDGKSLVFAYIHKASLTVYLLNKEESVNLKYTIKKVTLSLKQPVLQVKVSSDAKEERSQESLKWQLTSI